MGSKKLREIGKKRAEIGRNIKTLAWILPRNRTAIRRFCYENRLYNLKQFIEYVSKHPERLREINSGKEFRMCINAYCSLLSRDVDSRFAGSVEDEGTYINIEEYCDIHDIETVLDLAQHIIDNKLNKDCLEDEELMRDEINIIRAVLRTDGIGV